MRGLVALLTAVLVVASCTPQPTSSSPAPSADDTASASPAASRPAPPADMGPVLLAKPLPAADLFDLTRRMRGRDGQPAKEFQPVRTSPPAEDIGTSLPFWTYDFAAKKNLRITATLRVMTAHAKWWVQDDITLDIAALRQNADFFETKTYPTDQIGRAHV